MDPEVVDAKSVSNIALPDYADPVTPSTNSLSFVKPQMLNYRSLGLVRLIFENMNLPQYVRNFGLLNCSVYVLYMEVVSN